MNKLITMSVIVLITIAGIGGYFVLKRPSQTLPSTEASGKPDPLRLSLPAKIEDIFYSEKLALEVSGTSLQPSPAIRLYPFVHYPH